MPALTRDECVELEVEEPVRRATPKAILIEYEGVEKWIPQSLISDDSEVWKEGDTGTLVIPEWFARKEGLV